MTSLVDRILTEVPDEGAGPLAVMRHRLMLLTEAAENLRSTATNEGRALLASEQRDADRAKTEMGRVAERIAELELQEKREKAAAGARVIGGTTGQQRSGWSVGAGPATYNPGNTLEVSFFRDLQAARRGDYEASARLHRNNQEVRALTTTAGAGGEFAPPSWLVADFIALARPGRVTVDLFHKEPLPTGVSSVNLPKVATGTTTAIQSTQNSALSQTDLTSTSLSSGISLIGGKQVVSLQLVMQSGVPIDRVILQDLAADYAKQLGTQVLTGSGTSGQLKGYLTPSSTNVVTWTQASPTVGGFYGQLAKLQSQIYTSRFAAPDVVVMHPRRWAWFASGVDSSNRPLVVPSSGQSSFNTMAESGSQVAAGHVGSVLGMDVYTDPSIAINTGAGTNQDTVLMFPRDDVWFWEGDFQAEVFDAPYADTAGLLYRFLNFSAMIPDRYLASLGQIVGTGLVTPTFAS